MGVASFGDSIIGVVDDDKREIQFNAIFSIPPAIYRNAEFSVVVYKTVEGELVALNQNELNAMGISINKYGKFTYGAAMKTTGANYRIDVSAYAFTGGNITDQNSLSKVTIRFTMARILYRIDVRHPDDSEDVPE